MAAEDEQSALTMCYPRSQRRDLEQRALSSRRTFNLAGDPAAQAHALDRRAQCSLTVQFRLGTHQNLSVERAVGLLAILGAKLDIGVDAFTEGARQFRGRSSLEMNHIAQPGYRAGKCLI